MFHTASDQATGREDGSYQRLVDENFSRLAAETKGPTVVSKVNCPSRLTPWTADSPLDEVGCVIRIKGVENLNTAEQTIRLYFALMIYRKMDANKDESHKEAIKAVKQEVKGRLPKEGEKVFVPWEVIGDRMPLVKFKSQADLAVQRQIASLSAVLDDSDDWNAIALEFEYGGSVTLRDTTAAGNFPFDWQDFNVQLYLEPNPKHPDGKLRGTIEPPHWADINRMTDLRERSKKLHEYKSADPDLYKFAYTPSSDGNTCSGPTRMCSSFIVDNTVQPDWHFFAHHCADSNDPRDPWKVWPVTETHEGVGWNAKMEVKFYAQRQPAYFVWNALAILSLMEMMVLYSYAGTQDDLAGRQSLCVTLLLAVFALKFAIGVNGIVPRVSYLTMFDIKVVSSLLFIFFVMTLQHITFVITGPAGSLVSKEADELALKLDRISAIISWLILLASNIWYWRTSWKLHKTRPCTKGLTLADIQVYKREEKRLKELLREA